MSRARGLRPSFGFLFMISSYVLLISMFAWGSSQPELDRVWLILQEMQRDNFVGLSVSDVRTIRKALRDIPGFSRALIGRASIGLVEPTRNGWSSLRETHLLTDGHVQGSTSIVVDCRAPQLAFPVTVSFELKGSRKLLRFSESGEQAINLRFDPQPEWVQVIVEPTQLSVDQSQKPQIRIAAQSLPAHRPTP